MTRYVIRRRLHAALARRGFSGSVSMVVVEQLSGAEEDEPGTL